MGVYREINYATSNSLFMMSSTLSSLASHAFNFYAVLVFGVFSRYFDSRIKLSCNLIHIQGSPYEWIEKRIKSEFAELWTVCGDAKCGF